MSMDVTHLDTCPSHFGYHIHDCQSGVMTHDSWMDGVMTHDESRVTTHDPAVLGLITKPK
jgi:hypothetical protein